jgi:hypothetical protein
MIQIKRTYENTTQGWAAKKIATMYEQKGCKVKNPISLGFLCLCVLFWYPALLWNKFGKNRDTIIIERNGIEVMRVFVCVFNALEDMLRAGGKGIKYGPMWVLPKPAWTNQDADLVRSVLSEAKGMEV